MAANAATDLVASRPAALHASANDSFVQRNVITSHGLQYVPYDRTYKGLPVVGGDFVVVSNSSGQVLNTSVAQDQTINLASTTPKLTTAQAESIARGQMSTVDSVGSTRLVAFALGTPALAWVDHQLLAEGGLERCGHNGRSQAESGYHGLGLSGIARTRLLL